MKYELHSPCADCPFRKEGGIRLRLGRVRELIRATGNPGAEFACHKTTRDEGDDRTPTSKSQHCAGALIFAEKRGTSTQMMRIMERLRQYDPSKLKNHALVVDTPDELLALAIDARPGARMEFCNVVDDACEAPSGFAAGSGVTEGDTPAPFECWACGLAVCGACSELKRHAMEKGRVRVCNNCLEARGDEFTDAPARKRRAG